MSETQTIRDEALALLEAGDVEAAFHRVKPALSWPGPEGEDDLAGLLQVTADIVGKMAGQALADLFRGAATLPPDSRRMRDLGYGLLDVGLPEVAATVLTRCRTLIPGDEGVLSALASALEQTGVPAEGRAMLRSEALALARSGALRHQLALLTGLAGDLAELRELLPHLGQPADDRQRSIANWAQRVLYRADAASGICTLQDDDLRGWHWVLTGGLLTHLSPYGFEEGMNGRYAFVQDSGTAFLHGVQRLREVLAAMDERPTTIFALPDRDSEIAAAIVGRVLGMTVRPWPLRGTPAPGLIVAYDLRTAEPSIQVALLRREPGQILWAHVGCWTETLMVSPDIVTLLAQHVLPPWGEQLRMNDQTGEVEHGPALSGRPADVALKICESEAAHPDDHAMDHPEQLLALAKKLAALPTTRARERWFVGSPVTSGRFV